jgi:glycosyltransferase involved in cell wall biosynthesis
VRVGVYNRYWNTLGGGERYAGTLVEALKGQAQVDLIGVEPLDLADLGARLNLDLTEARFVCWPPHDCSRLVPFSRPYDLFVNATYGSSMRSEAQRSAYVVLFPHELMPRPRAWLERTARGLVRALAPWRVRLVGGHYDRQADGACWTGPDAWLRLSRWAFRGRTATVWLRPGPAPTRILSVSGPIVSWSADPQALHVTAGSPPREAVEVHVRAETRLPATAGRHDGGPPLGICLDLGRSGSRLRLVGRNAGSTRTNRDFLPDYDTLLAISAYSRNWVERRWGRDASLLPPPVDGERFGTVLLREKQRTILSVGRFFAASHHNKKHVEMLGVFRSMCDRGLVPDGWEYRLVGHVHRESDEHQAYFDQVQRLAEGYPVRILGDLPNDRLVEEYRTASIFWHAAGWGEDELRNPERFEHFGITTCEAMSAGCIPVVLDKAGQAEIVTDGVDGHTFLTAEELMRKTSALMGSFGGGRNAAMAEAARRSARRYAKQVFVGRVRQLLLG